MNRGLDAVNFKKDKTEIVITSSKEIAKPSQDINAPSSKSPPLARQSWGKNTDAKGVSGDKGDKMSRSKGNAEDDTEDEEAKSVSDDDADRSLEQRGTSSVARTGNKSRNQEDEGEGEVRNL